MMQVKEIKCLDEHMVHSCLDSDAYMHTLRTVCWVLHTTNARS